MCICSVIQQYPYCANVTHPFNISVMGAAQQNNVNFFNLQL